MSDDNKKEIEVSIQHPLEDHFGIEEGTTMVPKTITQTTVVKYAEYDEKDEELDQQFQTVHDAAMTAFEDQQEESEIIDPKYKARNAEVAVQFLNTALNATNAKAQLKQQRDKLEVSKMRVGVSAAETGAKLDRNDILRMFADRDKGKTFDVDFSDDATDADFDETED
jgi:hypothetical protein